MTRSFAATLKDNSLELKRNKTTLLQVNVGLRCNLVCKHCHLECGPTRNEIMSKETMDNVISFAKRNTFEVVDITGGAPELVPDLVYLIDNLRSLVDNLILRTNLTLLLEPEYNHILKSIMENKVGLIASFPSLNENQTNSQRGDGIWQKSIEILKQLNKLGFGMPGSDLQLTLVSNPTGAFLPVDQCNAEKKFKCDLAKKWGIHFTNLYTFANVPLGRFKTWLENSNNYDKYLNKLYNSFNPGTIKGLMCTSLISVSWDGFLYDCDFNQAACLPFSSKPTHVNDVDQIPCDISIPTDNHCYSCSAGAGFT